MRYFWILILLMIILSSCSLTPKDSLEQKERVYCNNDQDCICGGTDKQTGQCFVGNKDYYEKNVDKDKNCPDFCSGIANNLAVRCFDNTCKLMDKNLGKCTTDSDCFVTGCNAEICSTNPSGFSSCEWKTEYGCLRRTTCNCIEGECSWDQENEEYQRCMKGLSLGE